MPVYITKVAASSVYCLDRDGKNRVIQIDTTEYMFISENQKLEWLSLYLITGNLEKLSKMLKIAEMRNDVMGRFHNALYLGDFTERVKILEESGHLPLAYVTAAVRGLEDAERLAAELGEKAPPLPSEESSSLLLPWRKILRDNNWPLLMVSKGFFEGAFAADARADTTSNTNSSYFVAPSPGMPVKQIWVQKSNLTAEHAAARAFDMAMRLLSRELGISKFTPLKSAFLDLNLASHVSMPVLTLALERGWTEASSANVHGPPALIFKMSSLEDKLKVAYKTTTEGKFIEACSTDFVARVMNRGLWSLRRSPLQ